MRKDNIKIYFKKFGCVLSACASEQGTVWAILKNAMRRHVRQKRKNFGLTERVHRASISIFDQTKSRLISKY